MILSSKILLLLILTTIIWEIKIPLAIGMVFAFTSEPMFFWLKKRFSIKKITADYLLASCIVFTILGLFLIPLLSIGYKGIVELRNFTTSVDWKDFATKFPELWGSAQAWVQRFASTMQYEISLDDVGIKFQEFVSYITSETASNLGHLLGGTPKAIFEMSLVFINWIFFLVSGQEIRKSYIPIIIPNQPLRGVVCKTTADVLSATITSNILVSIIQCLLVLIFLSFANVPNVILWTGLTFFLSFIPVIGTLPVTLGSIIFSSFYGTTWNVVLLSFALIAVSFVDNLVRPLFVKNKMELGFFPILISIIGGMASLGIAGVVLGPLTFSLIKRLRETIWFENPHNTNTSLF